MYFVKTASSHICEWNMTLYFFFSHILLLLSSQLLHCGRHFCFITVTTVSGKPSSTAVGLKIQMGQLPGVSIDNYMLKVSAKEPRDLPA